MWTVLPYTIESGAGMITWQQFLVWLSRFGPLLNCLQKISFSLVDEGTIVPWFHGSLTRDQAQEKLAQSQTGLCTQ